MKKELTAGRNTSVIPLIIPGTESGSVTRLNVCAGKFGGGPVGLETLAASIGEDPGTIEDVYEPYLLKNGFIQRTPRGRVVTDAAYAHLGICKENE